MFPSTAKTNQASMRKKYRHLGSIQSLLIAFAISGAMHNISYAARPINQQNIFPNRPDFQRPFGRLGSNNLSQHSTFNPLNPNSPLSENQIQLRQFLNTQADNFVSDFGYGNQDGASFDFIGSAGQFPSMGITAPFAHDFQLNGRMPPQTSRPLIFSRSDPMTPFENSYMTIQGRHYNTSQSPANDPVMFLSPKPFD